MVLIKGTLVENKKYNSKLEFYMFFKHMNNPFKHKHKKSLKKLLWLSEGSIKKWMKSIIQKWIDKFEV